MSAESVSPNEPRDERSGDQDGWTPGLVFSLVSIVLVLELLSVSYMMVSMALGAISAEFRTDQGVWLVTAFLLMGAVTAPLVGKLADIFGKRKLLLVCIAVAALGSVMSAVATTYVLMVAGRTLSGLLVPCLFLSYSLIRDVFPTRTVPLAMAICGAGCGLITVAAPFLTGWLIDSFGWRSLFWFFAAVLAVCFVLIVISTPETSVRLHSRVDFLGAVVLGAGLAGILVAVSFGPTWGWVSTPTLAYLAVGLVLVGAWYVSAQRVADPLIRLDIIKRRSVLLTVTSAGSIYGVGALYSMLLPLMAMTPTAFGLGYGFGLTAEGYAIFQVPIGAMTMVGGVVVGILCARGLRPRSLLVASMAFSSAGAVATAAQHDNKVLLFIFAGVVGLGMGLGYGAIPNMLIKVVPQELQASTASVAGVVQSLFSAVAPVVAFAVMNGWFTAHLPDDIAGGSVTYTDGGYVVAFLLTAAMAVLGVFAALALPRHAEAPETHAPQTRPARV